MLIKIDKDRYINPEHIKAILPRRYINRLDTVETIWFIYLGDQLEIKIPQPVLDYLLQILDANDAAVFEQPINLSLKSRLAGYLRNQATGQTFTSLFERFPGSETELTVTLNELEVSNVIKKLLADNGEALYFHASNPLFAGPMQEF